MPFKNKTDRRKYYQEYYKKYKNKHRQNSNASYHRVSDRLTKENPGLLLWRRVRNRAGTDNISFKILPEDVVIPARCPILGMPLKFSKGHFKDNSPSIDRVNNRRGYTRNNIRVISHRANRIKNDSTLEELRKIIKYVSDSTR